MRIVHIICTDVANLCWLNKSDIVFSRCQQQQQQQLFPVPVPAPLSSSGVSSAESSDGIVCSPNTFLMNPSLMEGTSIPSLHILSSPEGLINQ
jgi:hypothetical protein